MRAASLAFAIVVLLSTGTSAAADIRIGVVAPATGSFAALGEQIRKGAAFAAQKDGIEIVELVESCEAGGDVELAKAILEAEVDATVGYLCSESLEAVLPAMVQPGIPAISVSVRSAILMEDALKFKWPFFRFAPSGKAEASKIVSELTERWKGKPFALIEDGTIYSRELVETVRAALEEIGMKPVFTDTYRPAQEQQLSLVRRLAKTGATHVFIAGDRNDTAVIARDAKAENLSLTFVGGDATNAANQPVPMTDGVYAVTLPDPASLVQDATVLDEMKRQEIVPEGYVLPTAATIEILEEAKRRAEEKEQPLVPVLTSGSFSTVLGPVAFDATHERASNPYRLMVWRGTRFVPAEPAGAAQ